jgi:hypothetical protein
VPFQALLAPQERYNAEVGICKSYATLTGNEEKAKPNEGFADSTSCMILRLVNNKSGLEMSSSQKQTRLTPNTRSLKAAKS